MGLFHKKIIETTSEVDRDIDARIKKYPKKIRKRLRELYKEYKAGNLIFPEKFDREKVLNKE